MSKNKHLSAVARLLAGAFLLASPLKGEVRLPAIFSDHMVLQQKREVPVWGTATPGAKVSVRFGGQVLEATADSDGRWKAILAPMEASSAGRELTVQEANEVVFKDVLVGEVWVCSGQSNMEWGLSAAYGGKEAIAEADVPGIRLFTVERSASLDPAIDIRGRWQVCSPETVNQGMLQGFSAVGFWFAREIHEKRNVPVGMIHAAWGGSSIQPWTPLSAMEKEARFQSKAAQVRMLMEQLPKKREEFQKQMQEWEAVHGAWKIRKDEWAAATIDAKRWGGPEPDKDAIGKEPVKPESPEGVRVPSALFNAMIRPVAPFAIQGVLWYQGESNATNEQLAREYAFQMPALISGWREAWGQGEFPFLYVQLPFFKLGGCWPTLRESQARALVLPGTGMAVALDLNQDENLHPQAKKDVALRLALLARRMAYGEDVDAEGPVFESLKTEGSRLRLSFKESSGLKIGQPPESAFLGKFVPDAPTALLGFEVAGEDKKFHPAKAEIEKSDVLVWSEDVPEPRHVRYAWSPSGTATLYDGGGLPAAPFQR